jgi:hypothetical protein
MFRIKDCGPDPADRLIIVGRIARVRRSVPKMFVWMIFSISDNGVSANGTGISWDAPTLFTDHQHCKPVSRSSGLETSIATTLVSTLYLEADYESPFDYL